MALARMRLAVSAIVAAVAVPAAAATVVMTPSNIAAALAQLRPGDRLVMQGDFTTRLFFRDRDFGGVTVDASQATLRQGMRLRNVQNITFSGLKVGTPGVGTTDRFALQIDGSRHVSIANALVHGNGGSAGTGLRILNSSHVTVRDSVFDGLLDGLTLITSPDSLLVRNQFLRGGSDGIKLVDNQRVIVSGNSCAQFSLQPGVHADCIQMWSVTGKPLQSDVYLLNNSAVGDQQGFASFDPSTHSGTRLTFAGNYAITATPHGISCFGCSNSRFEDNVISSLPNSQWRALLRAPAGSGNVFTNNHVFDLRGLNGPLADLLPARIWSALVPSIAGLVGSQHDSRDWQVYPEPVAEAQSFQEPVPEPATWLMMVTGFLMIGRSLRRRAAFRTVLA